MDIQGYFTKKGLLLAAKLAAGSTLKITRVCAGAAETAMNASALSQIRQTLSVGAARRSGDTAVLPVTLEAGMTGSAYTLRELGVYAQDPEEGEILYKVYRLSDPVEVRPSSRLVLRFYLEETVSQDLNVTVVRASAGLLTEADLEPVKRRVETVRVPSRTVELAASELPAFFNALPRLLTEDLTVRASGTLAAVLDVRDFYGPGSIMIEGPAAGGLAITGSLTVSDCSVGVRLYRVDVAAGPEAANAVMLSNSGYVFLHTCRVTGNNACKGVLATSGTKTYLLDCGIKNCQTAASVDSASIMALSNDASSAGGFSGNTVGARAYRGGVILLAESTPELLGGAANAKGGGLIAKNGSLL